MLAAYENEEKAPADAFDCRRKRHKWWRNQMK